MPSVPLSLSYACSGLAFQGRKTAGLSAEFPPAELSCKIKIFVEMQHLRLRWYKIKTNQNQKRSQSNMSLYCFAVGSHMRERFFGLLMGQYMYVLP